MVADIDEKLENNSVFKILNIVDRIQNLYLGYYDLLLNNLAEFAGKQQVKLIKM